MDKAEVARAIEDLLAGGTEADVAAAEELLANPYYQFTPRNDRPDEGDEQTRYANDPFPGIKCCLSGNGAGKSYLTSWCVMREIYSHDPPEPNTPVWILSPTLEQVGVLYTQNYDKFLDKDMVQHWRWYQTGLYPESIILKKDKRGNNFILQFFSYEMGREALQGANAWLVHLDEQCLDKTLIEECLARLRKWMRPHCCWYSLTPLQADQQLEEIFHRRDDDDVRKLWRFYRMNTFLNESISLQWRQSFLDSLSPDVRATRQYGDFFSLSGQVFKEFNSELIETEPINIGMASEILVGIDFGYRYAAAVWEAKIGDTYYQFDELQVEKTLAEDFAKMIRARGVDHRYRFFADWADPGAMKRFADAGLRCAPADKDVLNGIETMRSLMRHGKLRISKRCQGTIRDIRNYAWKDPSRTGEVKDDVKKVSDHRCDAKRYALHTWRKGQIVPWNQPPSTAIRLTGGKQTLPRVVPGAGGNLASFFGK